MQYKGNRKAMSQIARELSVDAVVEGTVMRSGDRVRITAQLIEAPKDRHLWAETYEGDLRDVLSLQDQVAKAIATEVKITLTPQEQTRLIPPLTKRICVDFLNSTGRRRRQKKGPSGTSSRRSPTIRMTRWRTPVSRTPTIVKARNKRLRWR